MGDADVGCEDHPCSEPSHMCDSKQDMVTEVPQSSIATSEQSQSCDSAPDFVIELPQPTVLEQEVKDENNQSANIFDLHNANFIRITGVWRDFSQNKGDNNQQIFTKGCKWAPDGTCILTNSGDNILRIFNLPQSIYGVSEWGPTLKDVPSDIRHAVAVNDGGTIYDFCWYPSMTSLDPVSCCFASCSRRSPVHLWDAFNGCLRATYNPYNQVDEIEAALSLAFSPDGQKLYCGFNNCLRIFDLAVPGRNCIKRNLKGPVLLPHERHTGIVSSIAVNPVESKIYALGSYHKAIGLYGEPDGALLCLLKAHTGGVTHIQFSADGTKMYSGGRKDPEILAWDLRYPGKLLASYQRTALTNQRIYFDLTADGKHLFSGNTDGHVSIYDVSAGSSESSTLILPSHSWKAHEDCTNGVSLHPMLPIIATTSGQRHFLDDTENEEDESVKENLENCLVLWWMGPHNSTTCNDVLLS